jgi:hypothetical protein
MSAPINFVKIAIFERPTLTKNSGNELKSIGYLSYQLFYEALLYKF